MKLLTAMIAALSISLLIASVVFVVRGNVASKSQGCVLISSLETGNRVYCGKACSKPEVRKEYSCLNGRKFVTE